MQSTLRQSNAKIPKKKGIPFVPFIVFLIIVATAVFIFWQKKMNKKPDYSKLNITNAQSIPEPLATTDSVETSIQSANVTELPKDTVKQTIPNPVVETKPQALDNVNTSDLKDYSSRYDRALQSFYTENYTDALKIFSDLLVEYPQHSFNVNCLYWTGECQFGLKDYNKAIDTFHKVIAKGSTAKDDDAVMMLGRCYYKLNDSASAKTYFNRLVNEYPYSEYVAKAKDHLNRF